MPSTAHPTQDSEEGPRGTDRKPVAFNAQLRERSGKPITVEVLDLSREGFQIAHHRAFHIGTQLWMKLPRLESLLATVKWSDGRKMGCQFETPLHEAVLSKITAAARG